MFRLSVLLSASLVVAGCSKDIGVNNRNPLPSFNESNSKSQIIDFVRQAVDRNSPSYIPPEDRIVAFDNDGTLWVEQPLPSQVFFAFDSVLAFADNMPEVLEGMPYEALSEGDVDALIKQGPQAVVAIVGKADQLLDSQYDKVVNEWIDNSVHPVLERKYKDTVYQPMMEVMNYLRANDFQVYIVSGGGAKFMRVWQPRIYGVDTQNIIGSTFKNTVVEGGDSIEVVSTPELEFLDDHEGKVVAIDRYIGKKPVMVFGNSDGDLEMMQYASTNNKYETLMVYLNHTDGEREFYYDNRMLAGRLEEGLIVANRKGWTIIDMKNDWKTVFGE